MKASIKSILKYLFLFLVLVVLAIACLVLYSCRPGANENSITWHDRSAGAPVVLKLLGERYKIPVPQEVLVAGIAKAEYNWDYCQVWLDLVAKDKRNQVVDMKAYAQRLEENKWKITEFNTPMRSLNASKPNGVGLMARVEEEGKFRIGVTIFQDR